MSADRRPRAAASTVRKQRHISARLKAVNFFVGGKESKLDEVISASAGPELRPGAVLILAGNGTDGPIGIQHIMVATVLEVGADSKAGFCFDRALEPILVAFEVASGQIEHCHFHAASDVHTNRVRDD